MSNTNLASDVREVSLPPEILFHRFFQQEEHGITRRQEYKGKQDLEALEPSVRALLAGVQDSLNESLRLEKQGVREHVLHPPFHLDYIQATIPNAIAFRFEGFSFIGITIGLIYSLWEACIRLSGSEKIIELLGLPQLPEKTEAIHSALFRTQLFFVVAHEYTHHVHGHVTAATTFFGEIQSGLQAGDLGRQAREIDADGYAAYHVLSHLIDSEEGRLHAIQLLKLVQQSDRIQDEVLFSLFVVAVGAFFLARPTPILDGIEPGRLTHPPQAARMNFLMHTAITWCTQFRPKLETFMTKERFGLLMNAVAETIWHTNGGTDWKGQIEFLRSKQGVEYQAALDACVKEHVQSL